MSQTVIITNLGNGSETYLQRQAHRNVGEERFEEYCKQHNYKITRLGFDEKNANVEHFYDINPFIRNLPDYLVTTPSGTRLVNVKGTGNIKQKEFEMIPEFKRWYSSSKIPLFYVFAFVSKIVILGSDKVIDLYQNSTDKQWHDGVVYRSLKL